MLHTTDRPLSHTALQDLSTTRPEHYKTKPVKTAKREKAEAVARRVRPKGCRRKSAAGSVPRKNAPRKRRKNAPTRNALSKKKPSKRKNAPSKNAPTRKRPTRNVLSKSVSPTYRAPRPKQWTLSTLPRMAGWQMCSSYANTLQKK